MTCTGARLAAFLAMDAQLSVPRDVRRYPTEIEASQLVTLIVESHLHTRVRDGSLLG